jgi:hypothetical protein
VRRSVAQSLAFCRCLLRTRRTDSHRSSPLPRGVCEHIASMHVADGHCVVCASKAETGGDEPCANAAELGTNGLMSLHLRLRFIAVRNA